MAQSLVGKKIGQYEITAELGKGGMAVVYRAFQGTMNRDVAMKVVVDALTQDAAFRERFNQEVQLIASLEHANIVPVHEHGTTEDGVTFLTMRYLKGGTLSERIRSRGALPLEEINTLFKQIAGALDYAHLHGVVHRDLKPSNILLDEHGNPFLVDFGLAQIVESDIRLKKNLTETGTLIGTPAYMSPEQIESGQTDTRTDLYALGAILFEMLAGRPPFTAESAFKLMQAHISEPVPSILKFRPELPEVVDAVLAKALAKNPSERYQSATALAVDFTDAIQGRLITEPISSGIRKMSQTGSLSVASRAAPVRIFAASLVAVVVIVVLGLFLLRAQPDVTNINFPPETQRPADGTPAQLVPTANEIKLAQKQMADSFIGVVACTLSTDYHSSLVARVTTRAKTLGLVTKVEDSQTEPVRQPTIINDFITQHAKVIFVCSLDDKIVLPAIKHAQDAGIIVLLVSDNPVGDHGISFSGATNEQMGQAVGLYAADYIASKLGGKAKVAILDYPPVPVTVVRANNMIEVLKNKLPNINILGRWQGGLIEDGEKNITQALKDHPDLNVIMSINDAGSYGAIKALQAAGKKPDEVSIFSVDAEAAAQQKIQTGQYIRASFGLDPFGLGTSAVDGAVKLLAGSIVPKRIALSGKMVTPETLAQTPTPQ